MKIIIGLGNPGSKYENTRHNVGFLAVDYLSERLGVHIFTKTFSKFNAIITEARINGNKLLLVKPLTYMNLSGEAVKPIIDWYKIDIEDMVVVYDDLDLPLGKLRIREKGSAGGHNGMKSIIQHVGTDHFKRIRIGIDRPKEESVVDHVLAKFTIDEKMNIDDSINILSEALVDWLNGVKFIKLMNTYQK